MSFIKEGTGFVGTGSGKKSTADAKETQSANAATALSAAQRALKRSIPLPVISSTGPIGGASMDRRTSLSVWLSARTYNPKMISGYRGHATAIAHFTEVPLGIADERVTRWRASLELNDGCREWYFSHSRALANSSSGLVGMPAFAKAGEEYMTLKGKTEIIRGSTRGIGFAIASAFARKGARKEICDMSPGSAVQEVKKARNEGGVLKLMTAISMGAAIVFAPEAFAQGSPADLSYCRALIEKYRAVAGLDNTTPPIVSQAVSNCRGGNTVAGIPSLERALRDRKAELPPRPQ
jgi:hypothetical protein